MLADGRMRISLPEARRLLALASVLVLAAGCGAGRDEGTGTDPSGTRDASVDQEAAARADVTIDMKDIKYLPQTARIKAGETVLWTNSDSVAHTVTKQAGPGPNFDSGTIPPGGNYLRTFKEPGKLDYVCTIHPNQTGVLNIQ